LHTSRIEWKKLVVCILIPLLVGCLSALLTSDSMNIYQKYNRPVFSPPSLAFPFIWGIIFIIMGISSYLILTSEADKKKKGNALFLFCLQLVVNFFWPIIFFGFKFLFFAFIWIVLLWIIVLIMMIKFWHINKLATYLLIPYLTWVLFSSYFNLGIYFLNKI